MPIRPIDLEMDTSVELVNDVKVYLRRIKRGHQKEINPSFIKRSMSSTQIAAEMQVLHHANAIEKIETPDGVDENLTIKDKVYLIENIPTGEYDKIRNKLEEMSFGVDLTYKVKCRACDFENETLVPVENNFFS
jgi:hypothetical protein